MTRWLWTAADGSTTDLSDWSQGTYVLDDGTSGELAPEYEFATQSFAGVDGEDLQQIVVGPRSTSLGMDLVASDGTELRQRVRHLAHVLRPRLGQGTLRAVGEDGTERSLRCYYRKGLDTGTYRVTRYRCVLEFWSPRPWWLGETLRHSYGLAAPDPFFPIPPITLSATTIAGAATIDLGDTDAPTHPRWLIRGPGSQLTLRNTATVGATTTVDELVLTPPGGFGDGQWVRIDTRPTRQSVNVVTVDVDERTVLTVGANLFGSLGSDPALWPLVDGTNIVEALLTGAGPASRIDLEADRLYSGAR
jgi:hypothetical protein